MVDAEGKGEQISHPEGEGKREEEEGGGEGRLTARRRDEGRGGKGGANRLRVRLRAEVGGDHGRFDEAYSIEGCDAFPPIAAASKQVPYAAHGTNGGAGERRIPGGASAAKSENRGIP